MTERSYRTACVWSTAAPWAGASLTPRGRARVATSPRPQRGPPEVSLHPPDPLSLALLALKPPHTFIGLVRRRDDSRVMWYTLPRPACASLKARQSPPGVGGAHALAPRGCTSEPGQPAGSSVGTPGPWGSHTICPGPTTDSRPHLPSPAPSLVPGSGRSEVGSQEASDPPSTPGAQ